MNRKYWKGIAGPLAVLLLAGTMGMYAFGAEAASEEKKKDLSEQVSKLKAAEDTDKIILVVGQGGAKLELSYHLKGENGDWSTEFVTAGVGGRKGMTYDKKEGDKKTPCGTYQFNLAFGIQDDPGSILPYHKVTQNDYWVDDSNSKYYNKLVNSGKVKKDWNSAEKLINIKPYYDYGLSLTYNEDCVPGKGSAIFLHCTTPEYEGSSGCICIPPDKMIQLLQSVDENTKIVIVQDQSQLKDQ